MAVLAAQDWHLPSPSQAMDSPTAANQPPSRQQHTPSPTSVTHSSTMAQQSGQQLPLHLQQQPYPYPVQQQQASWSPANAPYYPGFYQNTPPHPPYIHQGHQSQMSPNPFYDAANTQFAQWAYQQMMFQQNHQIPMYPQHPANSGSQRGRSGSASAQQDFYPANNVFNPFPSGTPPPPHPPPGSNGYPRNVSGDSNQPYGGFHPYRRPNRQQSQDVTQQHDWRSNPGPAPVFQPPYARNDASSSSTSVNSSSSQSSRRRKDSQGSTVGVQNGSNPPQPSRSTPANTPTRPSNNTPGSSSSTNQRPHNRHPSASSTTSSVAARPNGTASSTNATPNSSVTPIPSTAIPRPAKPSPLSQGNYTVAEKRMSRDDSDLGKSHDSTSGGSRNALKSRFRRALSFNALQEEEAETLSKGKAPQTNAETPVKSEATGSLRDSPDTASSTLPKKSRKPLFNSKLNASTDNISLSSTMSSASMVIRKLGSIGKLTRRNSLAGITSLFKDKKDKEGEEGKSKRKGKKGAKAEASEASVSLATVELDRSEWSSELNGLTPAARLARQHTLKTNAEALERAKAEAQKNAIATSTTREKNSSNRQGDLTNGPLSGDGTRPADEDSDSDDDKFTGPSNNHVSQDSLDGWDDNEDWGEGEDDEEITIRGGIDSMDLHRDEDMEPWAIGLRRSIEKTRVPTKGILKGTAVYRFRSAPADSPFIQHQQLWSSHQDPHSLLGPGQTHTIPSLHIPRKSAPLHASHHPIQIILTVCIIYIPNNPPLLPQPSHPSPLSRSRQTQQPTLRTRTHRHRQRRRYLATPTRLPPSCLLCSPRTLQHWLIVRLPHQ